MKDKKIAEVSPYIFDEYLIISFSNKWIDVCNGIPKFTVVIDKNGRLNLKGPVVINS